MWYTAYKINRLHINLNVWVIVRQILKHIALPKGWEREPYGSFDVLRRAEHRTLNRGRENDL